MVKLEELRKLEKRSSVELRYCEIIADVTDEEKNEVSHRGKALRAFVGKLKAYLEEHS